MVDTSYIRDSEYKSDFLELISRDYLVERKLKVEEVESGIFLPRKKSPPNGPLHGIGGIVDKSGNYVKLSACIALGKTKDRFNGSYSFDSHKIKEYDENVIYLGFFHKQWGHFLVDFVPRLWYFLYHKNSYKIVYTSDSGEIAGNYLRFLQLIGIDENRLLLVTVPTRYRKIIIPEASYLCGGYYTKEFREIFNVVSNNININCVPYNKVYLSRRRFKWYKCKEVGEKGIEDAFNKNGFVSLFMEELSLDQQIYYINNATTVAALSGTLCHNILFANEKTNLVIINKTKKINEHQVIINQVQNNKVTYIDAYREPFEKYPLSYGRGPFWISNSTKEFSAFFTDNSMDYVKDSFVLNWGCFFVYILLCLMTSLKKAIL